MAQLQWLGIAPSRRKSEVGEAIRGGVESYLGQREKRLEREVDLAEISYDKKKRAVDLILKQTESATPDQKQQIGKTQAGKLVVDVYGQDAFDTWMAVGPKGTAKTLSEVETWIQLKGKPSRFDRYGIRLSKEDMDREISFKLKDADWQTTYPDLATKFKTSYKPEPKVDKRESLKWPWGKKTDYKGMSDADLHARTLQGDQEAIAEAKRRGY